MTSHTFRVCICIFLSSHTPTPLSGSTTPLDTHTFFDGRGECTVFIHRKKPTDWQAVRLEREKKEQEMRRVEEEIAEEQKRLEQAEIDGDDEV